MTYSIFSHLLFHMYTDILHRLQILKSTQSIQSLIKQKESNINSMYSYVRDTCFCALVWFKGDLQSLYLHRDKYILIQTSKAVSRHSNSSTSAYYWYMTLDDSTPSQSVFIKQLMSTDFGGWIQTSEQNTYCITLHTRLCQLHLLSLSKHVLGHVVPFPPAYNSCEI